MGFCRACNRESILISNRIGYCVDCIRERFDRLSPEIRLLHRKTREEFNLPHKPPNEHNGIRCNQCIHNCRIPENQTGFCGTRYVKRDTIMGGRPHEGNLSYYYDPLPTNCVASFICPGGAETGYPEFSKSKGPEFGYKNLAVFYHSCSFNCLYCQNYHFKHMTFSSERISSKELAGAVDDRTTCICYFGGDPTPHILHAIKSSSLALKKARPLRICWETNGAMAIPYLNRIAELSLKSGGCIKFDLKAWDEKVHLTLCGVSNKRTLENFSYLSNLIKKRPDPPFLIASILLVPGYIDEKEVKAIASFISGLNRDIPLSLLGFHPTFFLDDLPRTSRRHALEAREIALSEGLRSVHIGNYHLLGDEY